MQGLLRLRAAAPVVVRGAGAGMDVAYPLPVCGFVRSFD